MKKEILVLVLVLSSLLLVGCGGGGGSQSTTTSVNQITGYFIDSPVSGLTYETKLKKGVTGSDGSFTYSPSDPTIIFKLGSIELGTINIKDLNSDNKLFIQDLAGVSRDSIDNEKVLKIAMFLQSLDTGENPNAITLKQTDLDKFTESKSIDDIDIVKELKSIAIKPKPLSEVKKHLNNTIKKYHEANTITEISHNGYEYKIVTSPITNKRWLDRNLGASAVCTKSIDDKSEGFTNESYVTSQEDCFGDLYQWGRLKDGHEQRDSNIISSIASNIVNVGINFIKGDESLFDWTNKDNNGALRFAQWSKTDGTSICPIGFRVPTSIELYRETVSYTGTNDESIGKVKVENRDTAFKNFLRFPVAGQRNWGGSLNNEGKDGYVWSNSVVDSLVRNVYFEYSGAYGDYYDRSGGFSVRCVED